MAKTPSKTTAKSTSRAKKTTTRSAATPKPVTGGSSTGAKVKIVATPATDAPAAISDQEVLRKKELIDQLVEETGQPRREVKPVVEAMLKVMGDALAKDRSMVLHPLGKIQVKRHKDMTNARMLILRVRQNQTHADDGDTSKVTTAAE